MSQRDHHGTADGRPPTHPHDTAAGLDEPGFMGAAPDRARRWRLLMGPWGAGPRETSGPWAAAYAVLNLLTADLPTGARVSNGASAEELLGLGWGDEVRSILYTRPLGEGFSPASALRLDLGPRTRAFVEELAAVQPSIAQVWGAWSRLPDAPFRGADRAALTASLSRQGWFSRLVLAHAGIVRPSRG